MILFYITQEIVFETTVIHAVRLCCEAMQKFNQIPAYTALLLQVVVGLLLLVIGALNINKLSQQRAANILNNIISIMFFIISIVNVILNAFGLSYKANELFMAASENGGV